jgi:hypothetical protein
MRVLPAGLDHASRAVGRLASRAAKRAPDDPAPTTM